MKTDAVGGGGSESSYNHGEFPCSVGKLGVSSFSTENSTNRRNLIIQDVFSTKVLNNPVAGEINGKELRQPSTHLPKDQDKLVASTTNIAQFNILLGQIDPKDRNKYHSLSTEQRTFCQSAKFNRESLLNYLNLSPEQRKFCLLTKLDATTVLDYMFMSPTEKEGYEKNCNAKNSERVAENAEFIAEKEKKLAVETIIQLTPKERVLINQDDIGSVKQVEDVIAKNKAQIQNLNACKHYGQEIEKIQDAIINHVNSGYLHIANADGSSSRITNLAEALAALQMNQRLVLQKPGEQAIGLGVQGENYSNIIKIDGKDVKVRTFYLERKEFATLLIAFHNIHLTTSQLQIFQMVLAPQQATQPKEELEIEKSETRKNYVSLPKAGQLTRFQVENETQSVLSAFKISLKTPVFPKLLEVAWKYHVAYEEHLAYIKEVKKMKRIDAEYIEETNKKIDIKSDGYKKSVKVFDQLSQETLAGLMENDHPELIILKKVVTSLMETTQTLEKKDLPLLESCKTLNKACVNFITTFVQAVGVNALPGTGGNNDRSHVKTG